MYTCGGVLGWVQTISTLVSALTCLGTVCWLIWLYVSGPKDRDIR